MNCTDVEVSKAITAASSLDKTPWCTIRGVLSDQFLRETELLYSTLLVRALAIFLFQGNPGLWACLHQFPSRSGRE